MLVNPLRHMTCDSIAGHQSLAMDCCLSQEYDKGPNFTHNLAILLCGEFSNCLAKYRLLYCIARVAVVALWF